MRSNNDHVKHGLLFIAIAGLVAVALFVGTLMSRNGNDDAQIDGDSAARLERRPYSNDVNAQTVIATDDARSFETAVAERLGRSQSRANPSFDCSRADRPSLRLICSDESLAASDRELSSSYRVYIAQFVGTERQQLLQAQRRLLAERDRCVTYNCVADWYDRVLDIYRQSPTRPTWRAELDAPERQGDKSLESMDAPDQLPDSSEKPLY